MICRGDPKAPFGAIHTRRKEQVAHRAVLELARIAYNGTQPSTGPRLSGTASVVALPGGGFEATLAFAPGAGGKLVLHDTDNCTGCCANDSFIISLCANASGAPPPRHRSCTPAVTGSMAVSGGGRSAGSLTARFPELLGGGVPKAALFMGTDYPQCAVFAEESLLPAGPALLPVA